MKIEYQVREVTRYIVTRYYAGEGVGVDTKGEFDNANIAYEVAYALCKNEHQRLGYPLADERVQYPRHPHDANSVAVNLAMTATEAMQAVKRRG